MPSETVKYIYEEIGFLSAEIGRLGLPEKFIEAAKQQDEKKIEEIFEQFKVENPELWERFSKFYEDYSEAGCPEFLDDDDHDEDYYTYDPNQINPVNLCFVLMFSDGLMNEQSIFWDFCILEEALREEQPELADYMERQCIDNLVFDLMHAFEP